MTSEQKMNACQSFAAGTSIAAIATYYGAHNRTIERVLREAFLGLTTLNSTLGCAPVEDTPKETESV